MPRHIEAKSVDHLISHPTRSLPGQIIEAFNTGLTILESQAPVDEKAANSLEITKFSLSTAGSRTGGLVPDISTMRNINHPFSRTGEEISFTSGVFVESVVDALLKQSQYEHDLALSLRGKSEEGFYTDKSSIDGQFAQSQRYHHLARMLFESSVPYGEMYDLSSEHTDIEAIKEYYAHYLVHSNVALESPMPPSPEHNQADWKKADNLLKEARILMMPPEKIISEADKGGKRWYTGCLPWVLGAVGVGVVLCGLPGSEKSLLTASPSPVVAEKPTGSPEVGIVEGVPTIEIKPVVTGSSANPEQADCTPEMEVIITEIVQPGDRDADRIYHYPNKVNPEGDSVKGLFEKELANVYVKDNPFSDEAIRYSLRNQKNDGRDVSASDPDLLLLIGEAKLFYGQDVTDAAILAFVDSIRRNNPDGTLNHDLIMASEFKAQSPATILHRLQELKRG